MKGVLTMIPVYEKEDGKWNYQDLMATINQVLTGIIILREFSNKKVPMEYTRRLNQSKRHIETLKTLIIEMQAMT